MGAMPEPPATKTVEPTEVKTVPEPAEIVEGAEYQTRLWLNVRKGPGMKFEVVRVLNKGEKVKALGRENLIWVKIGENEYVSSKHLDKI